MDKRRFIPFLPDVHQTETLKKYFGSTVDHVFQPGKPEQISGYIGQKPGYYDATKDFYVPEPTLARSAYQLEPAMMSYDAASSVSHMFFYDDLINYIRNSSGIVSNQNRLFADQYSAWAPPVDLDKLNNFHQYYWYGDNPDLIPTLTLTATHADYVGDGRTYRFALPAAAAGVPVERETPLIYVDTLLAAYERDGNDLALSVVPQPGAQIVVFRYGDLRRAATGLKSFDPRPFLTDAAVPALSTSMRVHFQDGVSYYQGWDRLPWETIFLHAPYRCHESFPVAWDGSDDDRAASFFVEGVGSSIEFVVCPQKSVLAVPTATYVTIDRRSRDGNPWSKNNFWVHGDAISWNGTPSADRRGVRPIVEFYPNIQLANYGRLRLPDITATLSGDLIFVPGAANPNSDPGDPLDLSDPTITRTALAVTEASGKRIGEIYVDGDHALRYGDRILVLSNPNPDIVNRILTVQRGQQGVVLPSGAESVTDILVLIAGGPPDQGDVVGGEVMVFNPYEVDALDTIGWVRHRPYKDYYFNGSAWTEGQARKDTDTDPLFALFTDAGASYGDLLGATFQGNRLFGFAKGTGPLDPILKRRLKRTAPSTSQLRSEILFENDQVTVRHGSLPGYQNYKILGATAAGDTLHNGWTMTDDLSRQPLVGGVFTQPLNLIGNPDMEEVETTARAQWFDHVAAILTRQTGFVGSAYQHNNWRDTARSIGSGYTGPAWTAHTRYLVNATVTVAGIGYRCTTEHVAGAVFEAKNWVMKPLLSIVQPRTPLLRTMLLTADRRFDYQDAVRFTDTEYQRFRNKFYHQIEAVSRKGQVAESASDDAWVDFILRTLTTTKTNEFAFALSTMAGGQWFIPPTAASMGLLSIVEPGFEWDDTYTPSVFILRGHDGSRTPMTMNRAASIMLALELRIWRAIKDKFKTESSPAFDFYDLLDSRGRGPVDRTTTGDVDPCDDDPTPVETEKMTYSRDELVQIYTPIFMRWAQLNGYDYRKHDDYVPSDPFTWNYRGIKDVDGTEQVGNWRGIYRWFFDTDRPHQVPWEMLGFATKPSWWEGFYGPAPYTRGNLPLWEDLRDGRVRGGVRAGIDTRFARPDLLTLLPIDDDGKLLDPIAAGIIPVGPKGDEAMRTWVIGDHGPIENLWMMSASYPYARSIIGFLLRPAQWIEVGWNTDAFVELADGQYYNAETHNRPRNAALKVHGEVLDNGTRLTINGVQQWISDMMTSRAQDPALFGNAVRGLQVRLAHKMAGYTQAENLRIFADNFGIVPEEDVSVLLHTSPPLREAVYSGVIVEWTGAGWTVVGYDTVKEGFCIIEGDENGPKQTISLGDDPPIYEWRPGVNYSMNVMVDYRGSVYRCVRAHTAATKFEDEYWSAAPQNAIKIPKVTVFVNPTKIKKYIPYGTVFKTREEVARFLWEWGLAQEADGFVFDGVDEVTGEIQNWELMIRKFLEWSQMDWQPGNFIALSPGASTLKFVTAHGYVANLEETANGAYGLIDRTGRPIARRATFVSRLDEETKVITTTNNLFGARMRVIESEHVVVFSGTTIFNDLIYAPLYTLRQPRLRVIGIRTTPWAGRIDAPGYMVNGNDLLANFERASEDVRTMFEIEGSEDRVLRDHARHVIGYQKRPYLDNLLVSETQQFEFYQGMIQAKGAPTVFNRLTRSKVIDSYADLAFLEEWAFRVGQFGATDVHTDVAFRLNRTDLRANPQFVFFGEGTDSESTVFLPSSDARWVNRPSNTREVFPAKVPFSLLQGGGSPQTNVRPLLPSAGPVRLSEVDYAAFDAGYLNQLYTDVTRSGQSWDAGKRVWLYNRVDKISGYDVLRTYRVGPENCFLWSIQTSAEDVTLGADECRLIFSEPHGLTSEDIGLTIVITDSTNVDSNSDNLEGFQTIGAIETGIDGSYSILIPYPLEAGADLTLRNPGIAVYVLRSQRFPTIAARDAFFAKHPPIAGQMVYVDEIAVLVTGAVDDLDGGTGMDVANPNSEPGRELDTPTTRAGDHALDGTSITYVPASAFEPYECRGWSGLDGTGSVPYEAITGQVPLKPYNPNDPGTIDIVEGNVCLPWRPIPEKPVEAPVLHGWAVYVYGPEGLRLARRRPEKIDSQRLTRALVYDLETDIVQDIATPNRPALRRTNATPRAEASSKKTPLALSAEPLRLEGMAIYDPIAGLIPGIAEREINYKTEFDPAQYFGARAWGKAHLGEVWWDTSKVAYLEAETDVLDSGDAERLAREIEYRRTYWGVLAPGSNVKVYEWVRSTVSPDNDVRSDDLFLRGAYAMFDEFDEDLNQIVTAYYYWVPNIATVPVNNPKRTISTLAVSQVIQNPTKQDVPWIAPIMPNGMLVGGIDEFVNDADSVFQFSVRETDEPCDGVIHNEYALVRQGDEVLPVPPGLLAQMNHALCGFDDLLQPVPDPALPERDRVGSTRRPRRSLLGADRAAMMAARRSYVQTVNAILARTNFLLQNPDALRMLSVETPVYDRLIFANNGTDRVIEAPPANSYAFVATSLDERDLIVGSPEYLEARGWLPWEKYGLDTTTYEVEERNAYIVRGADTRILVTNYETETPSWSIWELVEDLDAYPEDLSGAFTLSHQFTLEFATAAEMITAAQDGQIALATRVLVRNDERFSNFWTVWHYLPGNGAADANGFVYRNAQTYRTADFIQVIDWYAAGYAPLNGPIVSYPTAQARNLQENPKPTNTFVRLDDDGTGSWAWTVFEEGTWNTVARQNGTIKLSDAFCDENRPVYGLGVPDLGMITVRDGSHELRQIENILRKSILSTPEVTEIFFSLLHFAHAYNDQVNWAFKTSFMSIVGYNERLDQTPVQAYDTTDNLLDYVEEVKPYRVTVREFARVLTPPLEMVNVYASDFDKPLYFDQVLNRYRRLSTNVPADVEIMRTTSPWKDWYEMFQRMGENPALPDFNPVRRFDIEMRFDRYEWNGTNEGGAGWDLVPADLLGWDADESTRRTGGSAYARYLAYYKPTEGMRVGLNTLMGLDFKGTQVNGGRLWPPLPEYEGKAVSELDAEVYEDLPFDGVIVTEYDSTIEGNGTDLVLNAEAGAYKLNDPYHEKDHPEELVRAFTNSALGFTVDALWVRGAPNQYTTFIETKGSRKASVKVPFRHVAGSAESVFVYKDGVRGVAGVDYTVDHFDLSVTVNIPGRPKPRFVMVHVIGPSASVALTAQEFYDGDGARIRFPVGVAAGLIEVLVDGVRVAPGALTLDGQTVVLATAPAAGAAVMINVFEGAGSLVNQAAVPSTHVRIDALPYNFGQTWSLPRRTRTDHLEVAGTIVEVEGLRLSPPFIRFGDFKGGNTILPLRRVADMANLSLFINGQPYDGQIGHRPEKDSPEVTGYDFVLYEDHLYMENPAFAEAEVAAILREDYEYDVRDGVLTILKPLSTNGSVKDGLRIEVTTFENAGIMDVETHVFDGSAAGLYVLRSVITGTNYAMVWVNGRRLVNGKQFELEAHVVGAWEVLLNHLAVGYGDDTPHARVTIPGGQDLTDRVVITVANGRPADLPTTWGMITAVASPSLMGNPAFASDLDSPLGFDQPPLVTATQRTGISSQGDRLVWRMDNTWETFAWERWSDAVLIQDLQRDDEEIKVQLNPRGISAKLFAQAPFATPDPEHATPGVLWLDGERIEYFAMETEGQIVTFREIRRGTRSTFIGAEDRKVALFAGNGSWREFGIEGATLDRVVEVQIREANGHVLGLKLDRDYTLRATPGGVIVTMNRVPQVGETLTLAQTTAHLHKAGRPVRNATRRVNPERGSPFRIRDDVLNVGSEPYAQYVRNYPE